MIDISIEEAMRCLQIFQEQQPENGYTFSCFNLALSALKTVEDMKNNAEFIYTFMPSRDIIAKLAEFKCTECFCENCICNHKDKFTTNICVSSCAMSVLSNYTAIKYTYEWLQTHPQMIAQWKEEIERSKNNE